jgi:hypothetical protein
LDFPKILLVTYSERFKLRRFPPPPPSAEIEDPKLTVVIGNRELDADASGARQRSVI